MSLHFVQLYASDIVTVTDVQCRPEDSCCGVEETTTTNDIVFPRRGCFVYHEGRHLTLADANTVMFLRKDVPYRVSHPVSGGDDCTCLSFAPDVLSEACATSDPTVVDHRDDPFRAIRTLSSPDVFVALFQLHRDVCQLRCAETLSDSLHVDETAMQLLEAATRAATPFNRLPNGRARPSTARAHRELAERARVVLSERLGDHLTLPRIARRVHSSPFHLARVFRRTTGLSLHQYHTQLRLRAAIERLAGGDSDLTALALSLGFSSHSHFSHTFHRAFKMTPSKLRLDLHAKRLCEMSTNLKALPRRIG